MTNSRNKYGVKNSSDCYRNEGGKHWKQWTDSYLDSENTMYDLTKENAPLQMAKDSLEFPQYIFKLKKVGKIYRIYYADKD